MKIDKNNFFVYVEKEATDYELTLIINKNARHTFKNHKNEKLI